MKISLKELKQWHRIEKVVIHSLDQALYCVSVTQSEKEFVVVDTSGEALKTNSLMDMREKFSGMSILSMVLRQQSAYDEMVGHPNKVDNTLEVPLSTLTYPEPSTLH